VASANSALPKAMIIMRTTAAFHSMRHLKRAVPVRFVTVVYSGEIAIVMLRSCAGLDGAPAVQDVAGCNWGAPTGDRRRGPAVIAPARSARRAREDLAALRQGPIAQRLQREGQSFVHTQHSAARLTNG
jgi:hypothetical protein